MSASRRPYLHSTRYLVESRKPHHRYLYAGSSPDLDGARRYRTVLEQQGFTVRLIKQDVVRCVVT